MNLSGARQRGNVLPSVLALAGFAILIGLGSWQLERKAWKENLLTSLQARLSAAPEMLPAAERWPALTRSADEFRRIKFAADLSGGPDALVYAAANALRPDVTSPGYWVLSPARLPGGITIVVNRGFVPAEGRAAAANVPKAAAGASEIVGVLRWPDGRGMFTPADEPRNNVWYVRDPKLIADAKQWAAVPPFYVEMESPQPPGGLPRAGVLNVSRLPNSHLQYAVTWFGLAAGLAGVYLVWLRGRLRR